MVCFLVVIYGYFEAIHYEISRYLRKYDIVLDLILQKDIKLNISEVILIQNLICLNAKKKKIVTIRKIIRPQI